MKQKTRFAESLQLNGYTWEQYYDRMVNITISTVQWNDLPDTMDARFMELILLKNGKCILFEDEVMGFLNLRCTAQGPFDVYDIPIYRTAYASNGYERELDKTNSILVYNNLLHTDSVLDIEMFARRLYDIDRTVDVNVNAQKTPVLILCDENERLTFENIYKDYTGNMPAIFGRKGLSKDQITALSTGAPYVSDKLFMLKSQIWNEFLTYIGVSNVSLTKRERLITDEVQRQQGGVLANRYSRITARQQACDQFNRMFGTNISVEFREPDDVSLDIGGEVEMDE